LALHDQKQSMLCAEVVMINDGSKVIHAVKEASPITAIVHGNMDTSQRAFTAIMKHNRVSSFRRLLCSRENQGIS
jgi:hypothetical protein